MTSDPHCSTSFPGLEGSPLPSNRPASEPLPSPKSTRTLPESLPITGRMSRTLETCEESINNRLARLMSLRRAFHVSLSQHSDRCAVLETIDSFGSSCSTQFATLDRAFAFSKTSQHFSPSVKPELAYAAGIIDGEGCITIYGSSHLYPSVQVGMSAKGTPVVQWLAQHFGGKAYHYERRERNRQQSAQIKWQLSAAAAVSFLREIYPALILKRKQADVAIGLQGFLESKKGANGKVVWTKEVKQRARLFKKRLTLLNSKGEPHPVWITNQLLLDGSSEEFSGTWPQSGMIVGGKAYRLQPLVRDIIENVSSSSLPTPTAQPDQRSMEAVEAYESTGKKCSRIARSVVREHFLPTPRASANENRQTKPTPSQLEGKHGLSLLAEVHTALEATTPCARDWKDTPGMATETEERNRTDQLPRRIYADESMEAIGGMRLTPEFQCWLMGYPPDWLKPLRDALGIPSSRKSRKSSPKRSTNKCEEANK